LLRAGAVAVVIAVVMVANANGIGLSERCGLALEEGLGRSDCPDVGWAARFYYAIALFFLGGIDLGTPVGPPGNWLRAMWFVFFLAPAITTGAVVEGLLRALRPRLLRGLRLRQHIVLVGLGRVGKLYLEALRQVEPHRPVLVVDTETNANVADATERFGVYFHRGDITHPVTRAALALRRAAGVVLVTGNDLVNLEAATEVAGLVPGRIIVHCSDIRMKRAIRAHLATQIDVSVFNSHDIAATELVRTHLAGHFRHTESRDVVVLAGFGRFGQTILERLQREFADELLHVILVDLHADLRARQFELRVGFIPGSAWTAIAGDLEDPDTWARVEEAIATGPQPEGKVPMPVYVLGSDDDRSNLQTGLWLRSRGAPARIIIRCFNESSFTEELEVPGEMEIFGVSRLLRDSLVARHREWFS
jgi:voltage-gated potassium channel Kch